MELASSGLTADTVGNFCVVGTLSTVPKNQLKLGCVWRSKSTGLLWELTRELGSDLNEFTREGSRSPFKVVIRNFNCNEVVKNFDFVEEFNHDTAHSNF